MPDTISPVTREEDYLAAIAGQDVTPPTPVTRKEEWLDMIAGKVDGLAGDIEDLQDVVPSPEAADSGKVLTAGADGTASWQTASGGGGGVLFFKVSGAGTRSGSTISFPTDLAKADVRSAYSVDSPAVIIFLVPTVDSGDSPYYAYEDGFCEKMLNFDTLVDPPAGLSWSVNMMDDGDYALAVYTIGGS